ELLRFAADFVQRNETIVNVKRGVLEPLRHDRAGELLELEHEMNVRFARLFVEVFRKSEKQNVAQKIENGFLDRGIATLGRRDRPFDDVAIGVAHWLSGGKI